MSAEVFTGSTGSGSPLVEVGFAGLAEEAAEGFVASLSAAMVMKGDGRERALSLAGVELEVLVMSLEGALTGDVEGSEVDAWELLAVLGPDGLRELLVGAVRALAGEPGSLNMALVEELATVAGWASSPWDGSVESLASRVVASIVASFNRLASSL